MDSLIPSLRRLSSLKTKTDQPLDLPGFGPVAVLRPLADQISEFRLQVRLQTAAFIGGHGQ